MTNSEEVRKWLKLNFDMSAQLNELRTQVVVMTPLMAKTILEEYNTRNRPLKNATISSVESAIKEGRWRLTSQGISFSRMRRLNNGQNRLHAIVKAGVPVQIQVAFGEDDEAFDVIDSNLSIRKGSDVASLLGYKSGVNLFAAARMLKNLEGGKIGSNLPLPNHEVEDFLISHPGLSDAVAKAATVRNAQRTFSQSAVGASLYQISSKTKYKSVFDEFVEKLKTGANIDSKSPILILRNAVSNAETDGGYREGGARATSQACSIIKAWNLFATGKVGQKSKILCVKNENVPEVV